MNTFHLTIASVGENLFDGAARSVTLPGSEGTFEVLAHHEPIISTLKPGTVLVKTDAQSEQSFEITGGVVECAHDHCVVLL